MISEKVDIVILNHENESVTFVKADREVVEKEYGNDIERYIEEYLEFKLSEISWMCGDNVSVEFHDGIPSGGVMMSNDDYWEQ